MTVEIIHGDCREVMVALPAESVHCVVTSPPYWGLRDYGVDGQLGMEATPEEYVKTMVDVFRAVRRVLRKDGTVWLNMGDCYAGGANGRSAADTKAAGNDDRTFRDKPFGTAVGGLKPKDLVMMPARLALALQADGWWIRSDIIWAKPNPMPESTKDRPTSAHEHVFLMSRSARYFYDAKAVRTNWTSGRDDMRSKGVRTGTAYLQNIKIASNHKKPDKQRGHSRRHDGFNDRWDQMSRDEQVSMGANLRNVWNIAAQPYPGAHFATFPVKLVEPCIKAGCPAGGTVLDPFGGSGTVGLVAERLGRDAILIELNAEYAAMARARIRADLGTVETDLPETHDAGPLFEASA